MDYYYISNDIWRIWDRIHIYTEELYTHGIVSFQPKYARYTQLGYFTGKFVACKMNSSNLTRSDVIAIVIGVANTLVSVFVIIVVEVWRYYIGRKV